MVLLAATPAMVRAVDKARGLARDEFAKLQLPSEPSLTELRAGDPISHGQLIDVSKTLKQHAASLESEGEGAAVPGSYRLDSLLRGSRVYIPPPPPKKEPTPEYKALMARLRRDEEARTYERMLNPPRATESFGQRFPASPLARQNPTRVDLAQDDDEVSYEEVHRQIILIINVIVSIVACSVFIWVAARHWSAPKRLGLSMSGSGIVAIAEVVIYSGYVRRVKEAKVREKKKPEIKEIIESWVIDATPGKKTVRLDSSAEEKEDHGIRYRKGKHR
ncbi:endoplasmic reticulum-based factor for assembly of V-ATPase-domain-containing protein [Clohesyomyces aquaticus]|uniref:Endoplasmic reticulum-based factor for assembly of V-ATPase-domain-containing protein n=1 Tax=Clohesyomyces aquaticus TaxID=1231657 RepID=A0A1Y1YTH2_9PLEO|nr:endoplasmic reticulum-based factor for assembly of V-ATPase-domain-containing protein [Clohesyomyces aquaticus]